MKVLMVLTSHDQLGDTGKPTGFWLEEFAAPYYVFKDAGIEVILASPKGGQPPIDPKSDEPGNQTEAMERFKKDQRPRRPWQAPLSSGMSPASTRLSPGQPITPMGTVVNDRTPSLDRGFYIGQAGKQHVNPT